MSKSVALVGHPHTCPIHGGGPVMNPGQTLVRFNGIPLAVEGGQCGCPGLPPLPDPMVKGSSLVKINGRGVMRIGDKTAHGDDILKRERDRRKACRTCKKLDDLADPCQFLRKGTGGKYAGGSYNGTSGKGAGMESHHIPAQDSYPPGGMSAGKMPAISMDKADHQRTASHGHLGNAGKAYRDAQRAAIQRGGIAAGFAMDVMDIKARFGNKYDQALVEASAYVACISRYPDNDLPQFSGPLVNRVCSPFVCHHSAA